MNREQRFEQWVAAYDEKQLRKTVDFEMHRFVSLERDVLSMNYYVRGHTTLRGACDYLSRAVEEGEPYVPERILDLDTGEEHELELFAFVAPKTVEAIALLLPRGAAEAALSAVNASNASGDMAVARTLLKRAIEGR